MNYSHKIVVEVCLCSDAWEILKLKFLTKLTTPNSQFLMIFGGSSVTAGHDR